MQTHQGALRLKGLSQSGCWNFPNLPISDPVLVHFPGPVLPARSPTLLWLSWAPLGHSAALQLRASHRSSPPALPTLLPDQPAETSDSHLIYLFVSPASKKGYRESPNLLIIHLATHTTMCFISITIHASFFPHGQLDEPFPYVWCLRSVARCIPASSSR